MTLRPRLLASLLIPASALAVILLLTAGTGKHPRELGAKASDTTMLSSMTITATAVPTVLIPNSNDAPSPASNGADSASAPAIDGIRCEPIERLAYHIHAHLTIRIRGALEVVPSQIGFRESCLYWIHTHDTSGIVHVEAPTQDLFTLGQFFDIWNMNLDWNHVGPTAAETGEHVFTFVNGRVWTGDPLEITLRAHAVIELQIGPRRFEPVDYTFPSGF
jgi:hypothetical protein